MQNNEVGSAGNPPSRSSESFATPVSRARPEPRAAPAGDFDANCVRKNSNVSATVKMFDGPGWAQSGELLSLTKSDLLKLSPKAVALMREIEYLDSECMKEHGHLKKHYIFTDMSEIAYGAKFLASVFLANGKTMIFSGKAGSGVTPIKSLAELEATAFNNFALVTNGAVYGQPLTNAFKKKVLGFINDRKNNVHGRYCRFIILDKKFKEGIDLFDVGYGHLFEPPMTEADKKQVTGRGARMCGQKGLKFNPTSGWTLQMLIYDIAIPPDQRAHFGGKETLREVFLDNLGVDVAEAVFSSELESLLIEGAVDAELTKSIHRGALNAEDKLIMVDGSPSPSIDAYFTPRASTDSAVKRSGATGEGAFEKTRAYIREHFQQFAWPETMELENRCVDKDIKGGAYKLRYRNVGDVDEDQRQFREQAEMLRKLAEEKKALRNDRRRAKAAALLNGATPAVQGNLVIRGPDAEVVANLPLQQKSADMTVGRPAQNIDPVKARALISREEAKQSEEKVNSMFDEALESPSAQNTNAHAEAVKEFEESSIRSKRDASAAQLDADENADEERTKTKEQTEIVQEAEKKNWDVFGMFNWWGAPRANAPPQSPAPPSPAPAPSDSPFSSAFAAVEGRTPTPFEPPKSPEVAAPPPELPAAEVPTLIVEPSAPRTARRKSSAELRASKSRSVQTARKKTREKSVSAARAITASPLIPGNIRFAHLLLQMTPTQQFVTAYFTPQTPIKGMLLNQSVGSGKTCTAISSASSSFETAGYTILWVTQASLKNVMDKNVFEQICHKGIRDRVGTTGRLPTASEIKSRGVLNRRVWGIQPMSYKQFNNLLNKKNEAYRTLAKRNGDRDPFRKTLIIVDEAHKLYGESGLQKDERADMNKFEDAVFRSYAVSGDDSVRLLLLTGTPETISPMEPLKLLNLTAPSENHFPTTFTDFSKRFLTPFGHFTPEGRTLFLDKIAGRVSYLNLTADARQFAIPVFHNILVDPSGPVDPETQQQLNSLAEEEKRCHDAGKTERNKCIKRVQNKLKTARKKQPNFLESLRKKCKRKG